MNSGHCGSQKGFSKKFLVINENGNTAYINFCVATRAVLRKFMAISTYFKQTDFK